MARRISVGVVPGGIGQISVSAATLSTNDTNQDLTLSPNGTGRIIFTKDTQLNNQSDLRFADADSSNFVAIQAPAVIAANYTLTMPSAIPSSGNALVASDSSGTLAWGAAGATLITSTTNSTFYPTFSSSQSGSFTSAVTSSGLTFNPSTQLLSITAASIAASTVSTTTSSGALVVTGGVGIGGQLTVTSIVETSSIIFKENIEELNNPLETLLALVGVKYDRKDTKEKEYGFIAEDVYKVMPEVVSLDKTGKPYGIKYTKLIAHLVESVKELKKEIEELKGNSNG
jgi:hypothetical protein